MPAKPSNEMGHWESEAIYLLNNRILESAGSNMHDWLELNPGWFQSPKAEELQDEALSTLQEEFGSSRLFVLKDPRICRLAPFWFDVLQRAGVQPLVISPIRNPLEVASSLEKRDGFEPSLGHLLWLRHVLDAEYASRGAPRFFVSYERLLSGWSRVAEEAQAVLGVNWPRLSDTTANEIGGFLDNSHRHHRETRESVVDNPALSKWLRDSFAVLSEWGQSGEKKETQATLDRIRQEFNVAAPAFSRLAAAMRQAGRKANKLERSLTEATAKLMQTEALTAEQQQHRAKLEAELTTARERLAESEQKATTLEAEIGRQEEEKRVIAQARAEAERARDEFEALTAEQQQHRAKLEAELTTARERLAEGGRELTTLRIEYGAQSEAMTDAQNALSELRHQLAETQSALAQRQYEAEETTSELQTVREELKGAAFIHSQSEKSIAGLKEHIELLLADSTEREMAYVSLQTESDNHRRERDEARTATEAARKELLDQVELLSIELQQSRTEVEAAGLEIGRLVMAMIKPRGPWTFLSATQQLRRQMMLVRKSGVFDAAWYVGRYEDIANASIDPLRHYIEYGAKEGRLPNGKLAR
ncbi:MAG: hypothetical protein KIT65_17210 [Xanthobacteraceae bacterium]|nr:hypothetical protein [Xanthobacteraceae bacterium]